MGGTLDPLLLCLGTITVPATQEAPYETSPQIRGVFGGGQTPIPGLGHCKPAGEKGLLQFWASSLFGAPGAFSL